AAQPEPHGSLTPRVRIPLARVVAADARLCGARCGGPEERGLGEVEVSSAPPPHLPPAARPVRRAAAKRGGWNGNRPSNRHVLGRERFRPGENEMKINF